MSLAMIQRLLISSCKIHIEPYRKVATSVRTAVIKAGFPMHYTCTIHRRSFHATTIRSDRINPQENGCGTIDNISKFPIKTRQSKRNRALINDTIQKSNAWTVKALATAEEYHLEALAYGLLDQQLYIPSKISISTNCKYL